MFSITKEFHFAASHALKDLPDTHKCHRLHGHNYIVKIELESHDTDERGFVVDYGDLYPLKNYIDDKLDHRHLNDVLANDMVTAEVLAEHLYYFAGQHWGQMVKRISVSETPKTWAHYTRFDMPEGAKVDYSSGLAKPVVGDTKYAINTMYPTIQGEGVLTGTPMVLVRLHGCAVGCFFCDTKETWDMAVGKVDSMELMDESPLSFAYASGTEIAKQAASYGIKWIMLTGGEPADQDLQDLITAFHLEGLKVTIETSGTALGHLNTGIDWVCVSPKIGMEGGKVVLEEALLSADEIKHVVGKQGDIDKLDALLENVKPQLDKNGVQICLQPMSTSKRATVLCLATVQERNWRLSVQTHKYLDIA